jgi:adenylate cyclase
LCHFMARQKATKSGITLIFSANNRVLFYPDEDKLIISQKVAGQIKPRMATLTTLGNPVLSQLAANYDKAKKWQWLDFEVGDRNYVGGMAKEMSRVGVPMFVAVLSPLDELLGPVVDSTVSSLLVSGLIFLCVVPLVIFISWRMSRPLNRLARETDRIRAFELKASPMVRSRIKEIHNLSRSVDTMKTALRTFGQYVPKALVKQLAATGQEQKLGGEKRILTVLFSDVQNFTNMAESMDPEALMLKTSAYFEKLCKMILDHGGTIDKFIGDAIMAFWNAPHKDAQHQRHACLAMLACRRQNQVMDEQWREKGLPEMYTRFGLHSGETIVGNVGSADRMDYTALGATVNLASRLEGLNKFYGTQLLISQTVLDAVGQEFVTRPVDMVQPKGTSIPVGIHELVGLAEGEAGIAATPDQAAYCARWSQAFDLYSARDWDGALTRFQALASLEPGDKVAAMYLERVRAFRENPPPADWNGAEVFKVK